ncbi:FAD-binding oxidoreductase [Duganella sp. Root198D2]|uniref:FAD-binding oxidoreductase n=1 Tax=Duganella sp. Root198D2 TaxID=1736489 RepID=UPI0009E72047|nr:FAD-binding oxidoreductase [Duganella sp. Root198D2]
MDRRRFLELSGGAAAALLAGCGGGGSSGSPSTPVPPGEAGLNWTSLSASLGGQLLRPGDSAYAAASLLANMRFDGTKPAAIIKCNSVEDVRTGLAFVRNNRLAVTPRCGGHSWAGTSTTTGIVLNVTPMNAIQVNANGTTKVGAGARLAEVYDTLIANGVCIPSGTCLTVGIAGITMGGGIGILDRQFGLTCDNLLAAEVVTADGRLLSCDAHTEPELFWALRGGGGGNFGVATSFTFKTHRIEDITVARADFRFQDFAAMFDAWQRWPQSLPDNIWAQIYMQFGSSGASCTVTAYCLGTSSFLQPYWNAFLAATGVASNDMSTAISQLPYRDVAWSMCTGIPLKECSLSGYSPEGRKTRYDEVLSSDFFNALLPAAGIAALNQSVKDAMAAGISGSYIFDHMGGAISRVAEDASAFVHRKALFSVEYATWQSRAVYDTTFPNRMRGVMKAWSSGGAYVNYLDPLLKEWQPAYYGANYARLSKIKKQYDPGRVFNMFQGVEPA